ncbi:hypothetical protein SAMN06265365_13516 [Tistlia consotensis]|uniref:Uncharacterized protein n=1 Tax=Tistlia consotensis USBA 355 TaxID=560819 RepID=A0A1Y6CPQ8_9PROT|nr:hypothetical protein [Tistlia consotensis]SMF79823.1 hypothetical protein SAMN05428998_14035 [Tistlia consotensis USBA 355]SNS16628.1 hypothetical protein SAMN06265365_13516 [Tistlia consotensis]
MAKPSEIWKARLRRAGIRRPGIRRQGAGRPESGAQLLLYLGGHLVVGLLAAVLFCAALLAFDLFGLRGLLLGDAEGWLAGGLLLFGLAVTFGSVAMGIGVMGLERDPRA